MYVSKEEKKKLIILIKVWEWCKIWILLTNNEKKILFKNYKI